MKKNKSNKKKIFLILWGFFFVIALIVILYILLVSLQSETFRVETNPQQEQETYNNILNKIDKEIDKLTNQQEQNPLLKYPPKANYQ
ncbi:hypothetical protein KEC49_02400, partial ['Elaeagnus angustifolia' witches'-broom phytoplasma]|nr:hypothetical protein ['Elaeagnus angustifolia' witches'-broom phytoplasma]